MTNNEKPTTSEAQRKAVQKYKQKTKRFGLDFAPTEFDLLEHIHSQPKKQTYIKKLIRVDMEAQKYAGDLARLLNYLLEHEDTDTALMKNAGLEQYPSIIIESLTKKKAE